MDVNEQIAQLQPIFDAMHAVLKEIRTERPKAGRLELAAIVIPIEVAGGKTAYAILTGPSIVDIDHRGTIRDSVDPVSIARAVNEAITGRFPKQ